MDDLAGATREQQLERALTDANRQLLERDEEVLRIIAARDEELARARERIEDFDAKLARYVQDVDSLNRAIAEMQASRAWQLAERLRRVRRRMRVLGG